MAKSWPRKKSKCELYDILFAAKMKADEVGSGAINELQEKQIKEEKQGKKDMR